MKIKTKVHAGGTRCDAGGGGGGNPPAPNPGNPYLQQP